MKYLFAMPLLFFLLTSGGNTYACVSKDDCQCWCKQNPGSAICSTCVKSSRKKSFVFTKDHSLKMASENKIVTQNARACLNENEHISEVN